MPITDEYVNSLPDVYRDILSAFPKFDSTRKFGYGLSIQSLYSALDGRYNLGTIRRACQKMAESGVLTIKHEIFAHPTALGEELIAAVTHGEVPSEDVPPFPPPQK